MERKITRVVLTGGPCCGKTTLLNSLAAQSYQTVPEAARMIIEEEQKKGTDCLPWLNLYKFQEKVAKTILELEHSFDESILFCDRGILDGHAYAVNGGVSTPDSVIRAGTKRYDSVFLLDPIPNYQTDESRKEGSLEALNIHRGISRAYKEFGYSPVSVPVMSIKERADYFVKLVEKIL
ncbi:MAG: ATP-binding protein [archaeon]